MSAGLAGWAAFGLLWWYAFRHLGPARHMLTEMLVVGGFALAMFAATLVWVRWNVARFRRRGPSPTRLPRRHDFSRDANNVPVTADFSALRPARFVIIDVVPGPQGRVKLYAAGSEELSTDEAAACGL